MNNKNYKRGFIALISVVIINVILLTLALSINRDGFFAVSNVSDSYYKTIADYASESCVKQAIENIKVNGAYTSDGTKEEDNIEIDNDITCKIVSVSPSGFPKTTKTKAVFQNATTNYVVEVANKDGTINSWLEVGKHQP